MKNTFCYILIALALLICATPVCGSPVTFAQFLEQSGSQDFMVINNPSNDVFTATSQIFFFYENVAGTLAPALQGAQSATLTLTATSSSPDSLTGSTLSESGFSGMFSITRNTPFNGMANLLSGTFSANATLSGPNNGNSGNFSDSTPPGTEVVFNSDFINFSNPMTEAFGISLSSITPALTNNGTDGRISSFTAAATGTFSSDPPPSPTVPEPGSMLIVGVGLLMFPLFRPCRVR